MGLSQLCTKYAIVFLKMLAKEPIFVYNDTINNLNPINIAKYAKKSLRFSTQTW